MTRKMKRRCEKWLRKLARWCWQCLRRPETVWSLDCKTFLFGWDYQTYFVNAKTFSLFFGPLTLRWHVR